MKKKLSIIIVHYQIESVLFGCLRSIFVQKTKIPYEVIVVDNGSEFGFKERLAKKFKSAIYLTAHKNLGYGGGNNFGAKQANGKYIFFLNPDTQLEQQSLDKLVEFIEENLSCGIVAPSLVHLDGTYFKQQGALTLNPLRAIAAHSIFHKIWSNNPVSRDFWLSDLNKKNNRMVEVVPGTAFLISKNLFEEVGRFDETFFLYFEEYDLCKRIIEMKKEIWMLGNAKVIHEWGATTKNLNLNEVYKKSFKHYLVKHFGKIVGNITFFITQISKNQLLLFLLLLLLLLVI